MLRWTIDNQGILTLFRNDQPIWTVTPRDWYVATVQQVLVSRWKAWDFFRTRGYRREFGARMVPVAPGSPHGQYHLYNRHGKPILSISWTQATERHGILAITALQTADRIGLTWSGPSPEALWGFGEYGRGPRHRRGHWATWVEEGPLGLGPLSGLARWTGKVPIPKGPYTTYAPEASWLSSAGYAGWVEESQRIEWWVRGQTRRVEIWHPSLTLHFVVGDTLEDVIHERQHVLGGPPLPPPWVFAPWNDAVGGSQAVRQVKSLIDTHRIPAGAIWVEDWTGSWEDTRRFWMRPLSHEWHREQYPDLPQLADDLHQDGLRLLGYFCPEITEDTALYHQARAQGHLVTHNDGTPVSIDILGIKHGELDLTRPATRQWIKEVLFEPARQLGFDGWMADFGEYLPPTARLADGTDGWTSHNRYPGLWHALHAEFWSEARPNGDYTFFVRSHSLGSHRYAPVMWGGDSDTDWDPADGLPTVVPQALSAGLLGHAVWGTDIAGYMSFGLTRPSTKELYWRWLELGALLPVMRTHHGTAKPRNWHWTRDEETLSIYNRYARLHILLYPYWYELAREAQESGIPIVRPLFLAQNAPRFWDVGDQYLLGPNLLVAPVLKRGMKRRRVKFPEGGWVCWWTRTLYQNPEGEVSTPLATIPLFARYGALIPVSEGANPTTDRPLGFVDTLVDEEFFGNSARRGLQTAESRITLLAWGPPRLPGRIRLSDGGQLSWTPIPVPRPNPVETAPFPPALWTEHAPALNSPGTGVQLANNQPVIIPVPEGGGLKLEWQGGHPLTVIVRQPRIAPVDAGFRTRSGESPMSTGKGD